MSAGVPHSPSPTGAARLWAYRLLAVLGLPALLILGLEGGLRLAGYGRPASFLIPDAQPGFFRSNPDFVSLFMPSGFNLRPLNFRVARAKPAGTVRVVVLGESAAQGVPEPLFGFAPQLRALLRARYPGREIEVINTGIVAINSHAICLIARDLADFSPDLFVVYAGNNEIVGPYGPGCAYLPAMPPLPVIRAGVFLRSTRTGQLLGSLLGRLRPAAGRPAEWGGMAMFADSAVRGDDPRLEKSYHYFERNLEDIVRLAADAGAPTLLCTVVSNLKDCPPLLSLHRPDLAGAALADWEKAYTAGRLAWLLEDAAMARAKLEEAARLDPQHADTWFMLGSLALQAGDTATARRHFLAAQQWDALRFRPDPRLNEIAREIAARQPTAVLVDTARLLGSDPASTVEPAGRELLFEHVHLDWSGNHRVALAMAQAAETALKSAGPATGPWLDSAGCAAALGYTPSARAAVLQQIATITQNPPFTNQLTYPGDMARFLREVAQAEAVRAAPGALARDRAAVEAALARDANNPDLLKRAKDLADDLDDAPAALALVRRAQALQPVSFRLAAVEAIQLTRLGRHTEAEEQLQRAATLCPARELATIAPAFVDFYTRTGRFADGLKTLDDFLARSGGDPKLLLFRHQLTNASGDKAAAERGYRDLLAAEPGNQAALEALVAQLSAQGRAAEIPALSLASAAAQPRNRANHLRAAAAAEAKGDEAAVIAALQGAERSGPVPAALEVRLARKLYAQGRTDESLVHLAWARRIAHEEGDAALTASITSFIRQLTSARP